MNENIKALVDKSGVTDILADHVKKYPGIYMDSVERLVKETVVECGQFVDPVTRKFLYQHFGVE